MIKLQYFSCLFRIEGRGGNNMNKDFERIVYSYGDNLYRIAMHYTSNTADAQDIVQQTFLKMLEKNMDFEGLLCVIEEKNCLTSKGGI